MKNDKNPMQSKKFAAYLIAELTWKAIMVYALMAWKDQMPSVWAWGVLLTIVVTAGFIEIGYILSQAALDRYVRLAEIAADEIQKRLSDKKSETKTTTDSETVTNTETVTETKSEESP